MNLAFFKSEINVVICQNPWETFRNPAQFKYWRHITLLLLNELSDNLS